MLSQAGSTGKGAKLHSLGSVQNRFFFSDYIPSAASGFCGLRCLGPNGLAGLGVLRSAVLPWGSFCCPSAPTSHAPHHSSPPGCPARERAGWAGIVCSPCPPRRSGVVSGQLSGTLGLESRSPRTNHQITRSNSLTLLTFDLDRGSPAWQGAEFGITTPQG